MTPKAEIQTLVDLAMQINDTGALSVHIGVSPRAVDLTAFDKDSNVLWSLSAHEWKRDQAFMPKLRFIRNELERVLGEALGERREAVA